MGGFFSTFLSTNKNKKKNKNTRNTRNNKQISIELKKKDSEILNKIGSGNIYIQRHAASCANIIEKVFEKGQFEKTKYAANSGISYIGIQQCLQVSDYFSKFPINQSNSKKPLLIFICSELIRTQETLFLSWIKYLKNYKENNGKIIVLPWLNEVAVVNIGYTLDKDNYPDTLSNTKLKWGNFIQNLKDKIEKIKNDTLNPASSLITDIENIENIKNEKKDSDSDLWDKLFYLSPVIYKKVAEDPLSNKGKEFKIQRKGIVKKVGDMNQLIKYLDLILETYLNEQGINLADYDSIELVIVAHHNSAEHFAEFLKPSTRIQFKDQQLVNCEVVRLPGNCLQNIGANSGEPMERIFPIKFNIDLNIQIDSEGVDAKRGGQTLRLIKKTFVNPLFILYISDLNLFLSVNNIIKTRLKAKFSEGSGEREKITFSNKRIQVKKPLINFLTKLTLVDFVDQLNNAKEYVKKIEGTYQGNLTFYNYGEMVKKIDEKLKKLKSYFSNGITKNKRYLKEQSIKYYIQIKKNQSNIQLSEEQLYEKLKDYLFDFCGMDKKGIDSIAIF